jgi:hypothetical protein
MSNQTKVPGIPKPPAEVSPELRSWITSVAEALEIRLGRRGDPRDRAVTLRELIESGLAEDLKASRFDPNNVNSSNLGMGPVETIDSNKPPPPTGFAAAGAYSQVNLSWDYPNYGNHSYAEIYGHDSDAIGDAQIIGASTGRGYIDPIGSGATRHYWIRFVSQSNVVGPFNSSTSTVAATAADVDHLLGVLTHAITTDELTGTLETEIGKISGDISVANSVTARIAAEATSRAAAVSSEASARAAALSSEASARGAAILAARNALQAQINDIAGIAAWASTESYSIDDKVRHSDKLWKAAAANSDSEPTHNNGSSTNSDWTLIGDYTSLGANTAANSAAITAINTVDSTSTSAAALAIKALQTSINDGTSGLGATSGSLTTLSNAVNHTDTGLEATAIKLTGLETAVFNDMTGVPNWAKADSSATPAIPSVTYDIGARVVYDKKLYRAVVDQLTNVEGAANYFVPGTNATKWALDTVAAASAVTALSNTLTSDYATASDTSLIEAAMLNSLTGVPNWAKADSSVSPAIPSVTYGIGARVIYEKRLYRAVVDQLTNVQGAANYFVPGSDSTKWATDSITTASVLASSEATAATTYATATNLDNLESAAFSNYTGLSEYNSNAAYLVGARVTYGTGAGKKIYIAIEPSGGSVSPQIPTVAAYWDEDTLASQAVSSGAAAQALSSANTYTDTNAASASEFSALNAGVFVDIAGVNAWVNTKPDYDIGDRVYHNQRIYKAQKVTGDFVSGLSTWASGTDYVVDNIVKYTDSGLAVDERPYKCLVDNTNNTPHNNLSGENPKWAINHPEPGTNAAYWIIDAASLASAVSALTTDVTNNYARATDVTALDASIFGGVNGAPAWSNQQSYAVGARVTHDDILYKAIDASTNQAPQQPPNAAFWAIARFATGSALTELSVEVDGKATTGSLTTLESSIFNNVIGAPNWATGISYSAGATVTYSQKIYRALQSTAFGGANGEPIEYALPTNTTYWVQDTLTTADQVEAAYAKSSDVTVLQSNLFDNMVGVPEWNSNTTYSAGARVVHTTANGVKKLYKSKVDNNSGNPPTNTNGSVNTNWELDTLASATAVDSLTTLVNIDESITNYVAGQFSTKVDLGNLSVASKFSEYQTTTQAAEATVTATDALSVAIFDQITGVDGWSTTETYAEGDRVYSRTGVAAPIKIYKSKVANNNGNTPTNTNGSVNTQYWELDALAFAGAFDTLDATVNADGSGLVNKVSNIELDLGDLGDTSVQTRFVATGDDINGLKSKYTIKIDSNGHVAGFGLAQDVNPAGITTSRFFVNADKFAILPDAATSADPAWSSGTSYSVGNKVTREGKLYQARVAHSNHQPPNDTYWDDLSRSPFTVTATGTTVDGTYVPAGVYINNAMIKHASITSAQIGSVNADMITTGNLDVMELITANQIEASLLAIDNQVLYAAATEDDDNGKLMLRTGSATQGVKLENLSYDALGLVAQATQSSGSVISNQSYYPSSFTASTPWRSAVITTQIPFGGVTTQTVTLPQFLEFTIQEATIKEQGLYYIDFGATPFGQLTNNNSTAASQVILDIQSKIGTAAYTDYTSRATPAKYWGALPLTQHSASTTVTLYTGRKYQFRLYGHLKGFANSSIGASNLGYQGGYIRIFRIPNQT